LSGDSYPVGAGPTGPVICGIAIFCVSPSTFPPVGASPPTTAPVSPLSCAFVFAFFFLIKTTIKAIAPRTSGIAIPIPAFAPPEKPPFFFERLPPPLTLSPPEYNVSVLVDLVLVLVLVCRSLVTSERSEFRIDERRSSNPHDVSSNWRLIS